MNQSTIFGELGGIKLLDHKGACINCEDAGADTRWHMHNHMRWLLFHTLPKQPSIHNVGYHWIISATPRFLHLFTIQTHTYIDQGYTTQKIISQCDVKLNFRHSCVGTRCAQLQIPPTTRCFRVYMCFISLYCTSYYCFVVGTDPRCFVRQNCAGCRCPTRLQYQA